MLLSRQTTTVSLNLLDTNKTVQDLLQFDHLYATLRLKPPPLAHIIHKLSSIQVSLGKLKADELTWPVDILEVEVNQDLLVDVAGSEDGQSCEKRQKLNNLQPRNE